MAKAGGALPSWFWPNGVPRRAPVSQQPLARQFVRLFKPAGAAPALISPKRTYTYGELDTLTGPLAAPLVAAIGGPGNIAVCDRDPATAFSLVLLAWAAGRAALLLDPADSPARLAEIARRGNCPFVLTDEDPGNAKDLPLIRRSALEVPKGVAKPVTPPKVTDPALLLPDEKGILAQSHYAISGMATSISVFVPELKDMPYVALAPQRMWENWAPIVANLLNVKPVFFGDFNAATPPAQEQANAYTVLTREQAEQIVANGTCPPALTGVKHVFISCGVFSERWRVKLERILRRPALLLWGNQEVGPAIGAHPTWAPSQSHGFPLVNVTLFPIETSKGDVSIVPWEMLDRAEIGVEPPAPPLGYLPEDPNEKLPPCPKILRTHQVATVDNVGVITLV
ncbi:MAG: hypothetical protein ACLGHG_05780 [Gammaproteobacteria bacterium]